MIISCINSAPNDALSARVTVSVTPLPLHITPPILSNSAYYSHSCNAGKNSGQFQSHIVIVPATVCCCSANVILITNRVSTGDRHTRFTLLKDSFSDNYTHVLDSKLNGVRHCRFVAYDLCQSVEDSSLQLCVCRLIIMVLALSLVNIKHVCNYQRAVFKQCKTCV